MNDERQNRELIKSLMLDDMSAFGALYLRYGKSLYRFVLKLVKQETDAEGIVQEVFIKIWESRATLNPHSSFESFLFTIAYNSTMSILRKRVTEQKYLDHLKAIQQTSSNFSAIDEMQFNELNEKVQHLINQLTPRQKEIYLLSREAGLSYNEISIKLNLSVNTVENHMGKALAYLKLNIRNTLVVNVFLANLFLG